MEPAFRQDLATRADLADLRAEMANLKAAFESKLRAQTWTVVTVMVAAVGLTHFA